MSDYTPGIGPIRDAWRHERARHAGESKPRVYDAEFDRWKAENDRQVAAKAWDEGEDAGAENQGNWDGWRYTKPQIANPYRTQSGASND